MDSRILKMAFDLEDQLIKWRRDFHMYPELGFKEFRTSKKVLEELTRLNIEATPGVGGTGVIGFIKGRQKGKTIALRADMDALPITEENDVPYRSKNQGIMHACGHDGHTSILLGAATILAELRGSLKGNVKLIFQPAEEIPEGGASTLINEGVLKKPDVHSIVGLHIVTRFPSGKIAIKQGVVTAATDKLKIHIEGKSGHAARPHEAVDSIIVASQIITSIQALVTRETDALEPKVISIGRINGGEAHNVIAKDVIMSGTIRTFSKETRERVHKLLRNRCKSIAREMGAKADVKITQGTPPQINQPGLFEALRVVLPEVLGKENVMEFQTPSLGGEDFAFYSEKVPGFFFFLGCGNDKGKVNYPLHSSHFDFDDSILKKGTAAMACGAMALME
jgi:amidohydrolase